ncbi:N-acetylneuraminate synthase family protein [Candidatus Gracilibacteria bacterium]|nr:N-acetylneuraminate synthase family protein [Candidatus Gracilibacteria bacterium]
MKIINLPNFFLGQPDTCYIIGDIGINHNGDLKIVKKLVQYAKVFDFNCVKFQKRNPDKCVPENQKNVMRETPWGNMTYLDYKKKIEFNKEQYDEIFLICKNAQIDCSVSVWDIDSLNFIMNYDIPFLKIPSALITDLFFLKECALSKKPIIMSTGMSTIEEVDIAVNTILKYNSDLSVLHCTSTYPCKIEELNLRCIQMYIERYPDCVIGYSGHEFGLDTSVFAAALGAKIIERHITLDRMMWGTDQMASVEPQGMYRLVRDIRLIFKALGDGEKKLINSELNIKTKLRGK